VLKSRRSAENTFAGTAMVEKHENTAIVFADISGSTKLYVDIGDDRAREIVARTLDVWSSLTMEAGGNVIQLRGDGMLCMFPTVNSALHAAVLMRDLPYQSPLSMHAGVHVGPVLHEAEQLYGDVVNVAARMADIAKKFEIVLTADARRQLSESPHSTRLRLISGVPVKGKAVPMDVYLLPDDRRGLTDYQPPLRKAVIDGLSLRYFGRTFLVSVAAGGCLVGRDDDCRLRIEHRLVSRRHASIECVAGKFFLQDHSTNGTYVAERNSEPVLVHRELLQLKEPGVISLGIEPQFNVEHSIVFSFER
jgi:class 3 adenylate cyclase